MVGFFYRLKQAYVCNIMRCEVFGVLSHKNYRDKLYNPQASVKAADDEDWQSWVRLGLLVYFNFPANNALSLE